MTIPTNEEDLKFPLHGAQQTPVSQKKWCDRVVAKYLSQIDGDHISVNVVPTKD